jgi:enediyne biosynthesis protein E4
MTRRRVGIVLGVVAVAAVAVAGAAFLLGRPAGTTPTAAMAPPQFTEETASAGLDHTYGGGTTFYTGGGVAVFDCNADGRPDAYVAGGSRPAALFRNDSPTGGALRFTRLPDAATDLSDVTGAYPLDVDADGNVDLAVLRVGENVLLRGLGGCRFERANEAWGFAGGDAWSTAFSARWDGAASLPTLAVGNYVGLDPAGEPTFDCADNELFAPGAGSAGYGAPTALTPGYCTLSILFSDWDLSGRRDLRMTNDRHYYTTGSDQLWRIEATGPPHVYTPAEGWVPLQIWGMGIAGYDLTGDGYPEYYLTSQGDNKLQTLTVGPEKPTFRDIALKRGVTAAQPFTGGDPLPSTAWHPEFADTNNDGFVDLFVSKGNVSETPDYAAKDPSNLLIGQPDGTFQDGAVAAGIVSFDRGRGAALADFNLDGLLDLVEVNLDAPVRLWRNVGAGTVERPAPMGHWLAVKVTQPAPNRDAIGGWLEARLGDTILRRELVVGGGHVGGQLGWVHLGLGPSSEADVRVTWPDGEVGPWIRVAADQFVEIERGATDVRAWQPAGG